MVWGDWRSVDEWEYLILKRDWSFKRVICCGWFIINYIESGNKEGIRGVEKEVLMILRKFWYG